MGVSTQSPQVLPPCCVLQGVSKSRGHIVALYQCLTLTLFHYWHFGLGSFLFFGREGSFSLLLGMVRGILHLYLLDETSTPPPLWASKMSPDSASCPWGRGIVPIWKPLTQIKSKCTLGTYCNTRNMDLRRHMVADVRLSSIWLSLFRDTHFCPTHGRAAGLPFTLNTSQGRNRRVCWSHCQAPLRSPYCSSTGLCLLTCRLEISMKNGLVK